MTIKVDATLMQRALLGLVALFFLAHLVGQYAEHILGLGTVKGFVPRFDLIEELSVPTWSASILLLSCAVCLLLITVAHRRTGSGESLAWAGLALVFLYLALDEAVSVHEIAIVPLREALGIERGWLYFAWVLPAIVLLALFGLLYLPFLRRLDPRWRRAFVQAGVVFVAGGLGLEVVGGWYLSTRGDSFLYSMILGMEEMLEFVGVILFLTALVRYLSRMVGGIHLDLRPSRG